MKKLLTLPLLILGLLLLASPTSDVRAQTVAPKVAIIGSSTFDHGCNKSYGFVKILKQQLPNITFDCFAKSGTTPTFFAEQYFGSVKNKGYNVLLIYAGLNGLSKSISDAQKNLESIFTDAKQSGTKIIVVGAQPFKGYETWSEQWANNLKANNAWAASHPNVDVFIDFASLVDKDNDGALDADVKSDFLHTNAKGHELLASALIAKGFSGSSFSASDITKAVLTPTDYATEKSIAFVTPNTQIKIPGVDFTSPEAQPSFYEDGGVTYLSIPTLGPYIAAIYKYAIAVASVIALLVIIISGIQMILPFGGDNQSSAKKRIGHAITGLAIAGTSYLLLYAVNPNLVSFKALQVLYIRGEQLPLQEERAASGQVATNLLAGIKAPPGGAIPQLVDGVYSKGLTVPPAAGCGNVCIGKRCATQQIRDMAYEAQLKTGYPAAMMIVQYLVEGSTFGIKCKGGFEPAKNLNSWGAKDNPVAAKVSIDQAKAIVNCEARPYCGSGYTWECSNKEKYKNEKKPVAARDYTDGNPNGTAFKNCGEGPKKNQGYIRISGIACFSTPPQGGNIFAPLIAYYERHPCFQKAKDEVGASPELFAVRVQKCGYATSQNYATELVGHMKSKCLIGQPTASVPSSNNSDELPKADLSGEN